MAKPKQPKNQPPEIPEYEWHHTTKPEREQHKKEARYWIKHIRQNLGLNMRDAPDPRKFTSPAPAPKPVPAPELELPPGHDDWLASVPPMPGDDRDDDIPKV